VYSLDQQARARASENLFKWERARFVSRSRLVRKCITYNRISNREALISTKVDRQLGINKTVVLATLLDPSTKVLASTLVTDDQLKKYFDCIASAPGNSCCATNITLWVWALFTIEDYTKLMFLRHQKR